MGVGVLIVRKCEALHIIYLRIQHGKESDMGYIIWSWHPLHQHQGPKGVDHVHPGALGDYLQRQMGYQKIRCNPQMQNILLDRT